MNNYLLFGFHNFTKLNYRTIAVILSLSLSILFGCSHTEKVLVSPRIDLKAYRTIGVIDFSITAESDLREYVTQHYIQAVLSAQPGVRLLELGTKEHVLATVSRKQLDLAAIKSIGGAYHVDALIFGHFSASEPKPNVRLSSTWRSMHAGAIIEASLISKLWETDSGVILWTNSTLRKEPVARLKADTSGNIEFSASDPKETYGHLAQSLFMQIPPISDLIMFTARLSSVLSEMK
jgi:hypothetical protein